MTVEPVWPKRPQGMQLRALVLVTGQLGASRTSVPVNQVMLHPLYDAASDVTEPLCHKAVTSPPGLQWEEHGSRFKTATALSIFKAK